MELPTISPTQRTRAEPAWLQWWALMAAETSTLATQWMKRKSEDTAVIVGVPTAKRGDLGMGLGLVVDFGLI